jgi:hypothetical protein
MLLLLVLLSSAVCCCDERGDLAITSWCSTSLHTQQCVRVRWYAMGESARGMLRCTRANPCARINARVSTSAPVRECVHVASLDKVES